MDCANLKKLEKFSDFAELGMLEGKKKRIEDILNVDIIITAYRISKSKYEMKNSSDCLTIQFAYEDNPMEKFIIFTGSGVLSEQIKKYEEKIPFIAKIVKIDRYFKLA